jgi:hypothetical protein
VSDALLHIQKLRKGRYDKNNLAIAPCLDSYSATQIFVDGQLRPDKRATPLTTIGIKGIWRGRPTFRGLNRMSLPWLSIATQWLVDGQLSRASCSRLASIMSELCTAASRGSNVTIARDPSVPVHWLIDGQDKAGLKAVPARSKDDIAVLRSYGVGDCGSKVSIVSEMPSYSVAVH